MRKLSGILTTVVLALTLSGAGFAQKGGNDNRPPKDRPQVVERPKPPPSNNNSNRGNNNNRGRGKP